MSKSLPIIFNTGLLAERLNFCRPQYILCCKILASEIIITEKFTRLSNFINFAYCADNLRGNTDTFPCLTYVFPFARQFRRREWNYQNYHLNYNLTSKKRNQLRIIALHHSHSPKTRAVILQRPPSQAWQRCPACLIPSSRHLLHGSMLQTSILTDLIFPPLSRSRWLTCNYWREVLCLGCNVLL